MTVWKLKELYEMGKLVEFDLLQLQQALTSLEESCRYCMEHRIKELSITVVGEPKPRAVSLDEMSTMCDLVSEQIKTRYGCDD
jgi:hypothetical protein